jgi:hypothetical protein
MPPAVVITELIGIPGIGKSTITNLVKELARGKVATKSELSGGSAIAVWGAGAGAMVSNWRPITHDVRRGLHVVAGLRYFYWQIAMSKAIASFVADCGGRALVLDQGFGQASASLAWRGGDHLGLELIETLHQHSRRPDCIYRVIRLHSDLTIVQHRIQNRSHRTSPLDMMPTGQQREQLVQWSRTIDEVVGRIIAMAPGVELYDMPADGPPEEAAELLLELCI